MGSVQSSSTTPALAAQQNSNLQATIQTTQASITALQPQVANYTAQVQALAAKVGQDYQALATDPTSKTLQTALTADLAVLQTANANLSTATNQLQTLIQQLPTLIASAKAQDAEENSQQKTTASQAQSDKDEINEQAAQSAADAAQPTMTAATAASQVGEKQLSAGSAQVAASVLSKADSYGSASSASSSSSAGLSDLVGASSSASKSSATSASGSAVNAASILASEGIDADSWLKQHAASVKAEIGANALDNLLASLSKSNGGDSDSSGKSGTKKTTKTAKGAAGATTLGASSGSSAAGTLGAAAPTTNSAIPSSFTSNTSANGGVSSSTTADKSTGTLGFAQSDSAATSTDGVAAVNPSNLSANEIIMLVMLEATDELNKEMQGMAQQLQKATAQKTVLRGQLNAINGKINYSTNLSAAQSQTNATEKAKSTNVQNDLDSIGDDTQMMQLRPQNLMQMQQQFIQAVSNVSKNLNDTSMAILRHIGS